MGMQQAIKMNVGTTEVLRPYQVVDEIEKVMEAGETCHGHDSWEDHLANAFTRLLMTVAIERGYVKEDDPSEGETIIIDQGGRP